MIFPDVKREMKKATASQTLPAGVAKVLKRLHYPLEVILLCVRWYVAYSLSLRNLEEMMAASNQFAIWAQTNIRKTEKPRP